MTLRYPEILPDDSRLDVCVKGGFYTPQEATEIQEQLDNIHTMPEWNDQTIAVRDQLLVNIEKYYDIVLNNMRVERTIAFKALFLGADHEEVERATNDDRCRVLYQVLSKARRAYQKNLCFQ